MSGASTLSLTSGVRITESAIRSRAARISSRVTESIVDALTTKLHAGARPVLDCFPVDVIRRCKIFDCDSQRLEQSDIVATDAAFDFTRQQLANLAEDMLIADS